MPLTNVTTAITAATPITTPSSVSTDLSLLAHSESRAIRIASVIFMQSKFIRQETLSVYQSPRRPQVRFIQHFDGVYGKTRAKHAATS